MENIDDPGMVVPDLGRRREKGQEWSRQSLPWVTQHPVTKEKAKQMNKRTKAYSKGTQSLSENTETGRTRAAQEITYHWLVTQSVK